MPVNTAYLNVAGTQGPPIGPVSQFTMALAQSVVPNASILESSVSIPARLLPLNRSSGTLLNTATLVMVGPDSAISSPLGFCAYAVTATNTVTLRFVNPSASTVTQRAATWGFGLIQGLP